MRKTSFRIGVSLALALSLGFALSLGPSDPVLADEASGPAKARTTGSTKPNLGNGPADEKSLPSSAPPATTTATTGATDQNKTVKSMNSNEKAKVDATGK
jgi:hypothetical protein